MSQQKLHYSDLTTFHCITLHWSTRVDSHCIAICIANALNCIEMYCTQMLELELTHIAGGNRETQLDPDHHQLLQSAQVRHRQQTLPQHCPRYLSGKTWCQANPRHDMVVMFSRVCILKLCILKKKDFSDVYIFKESQSIFEYALRYAWCYPLWWVRDCTVHNSCQPFKTLEKVVIHMRNLEWGE